ncbi:hypothetical protein Enr13x_71340 [Stieleria neptunia]|uniref:Uncharacterized protein n=1 Tax=Stieleria neptunia TaxID=2527979 RepID=A0A518I291_9BACT|nr:hypothetical protein Enr13x_71340 [Stieleria neptunia]
MTRRWLMAHAIYLGSEGVSGTARAVRWRFNHTVKDRRARALPLTKNTPLGVKVDGIGLTPRA